MMTPVTCRMCGNCVLVHKNSLAHTAIQWGDSTRCVEFALTAGVEARVSTPSCRELRASIESAVRSGALSVGPPEDREAHDTEPVRLDAQATRHT